ncbi:MAG TPA: DEAD/DEAH box helicase [Spirochaetales bacterium]|nr:DEAD/DEAH box helicase [Spirochaetales bacterium]
MSLPEFEALGLAPACIKALAHEGYECPTPIQAAAIPPLLAGKDLLGCAQTGTGKTAAFALPTIQRLSQSPKPKAKRSARALVVAPTRELAMQIDASFAAYGRHASVTRACVYGGVGKVPQLKALERGVDVLVATPGRLLDLVGDRGVDLSSVEIAVLDEADRMLDMGFIHDVRRVMALLPRDRQTLLFSATMPPEIEALARGFLRDPARVSIDPEKPAVEAIEQSLYYVDKADKRDLLAHLIRERAVARAVVFSRTKHGADRIAKGLHAVGIPAGVIHANKGQGNRTKTMDAFRSGSTPILVATDIAARGIDVDDITHVFNFDQPTEPETYVHRIGRTARAGASGSAISFCDPEEKKFLKQVEKLLGRSIPVVHEHPYARGQRADRSEPAERAEQAERLPGTRSDRGRRRQGSPRPQGGARQDRHNASGRPGPAGRKPQERAGRPSTQEARGPVRPSVPPAPARAARPQRTESAERPTRDLRSAIDELTGRSSMR